MLFEFNSESLIKAIVYSEISEKNVLINIISNQPTKKDIQLSKDYSSLSFQLPINIEIIENNKHIVNINQTLLIDDDATLKLLNFVSFNQLRALIISLSDDELLDMLNRTIVDIRISVQTETLTTEKY